MSRISSVPLCPRPDLDCILKNLTNQVSLNDCLQTWNGCGYRCVRQCRCWVRGYLGAVRGSMAYHRMGRFLRPFVCFTLGPLLTQATYMCAYPRVNAQRGEGVLWRHSCDSAMVLTPPLDRLELGSLESAQGTLTERSEKGASTTKRIVSPGMWSSRSTVNLS